MGGEGRVGIGHGERRDLHAAEGEGWHAKERATASEEDPHRLGDLSGSAEAGALLDRHEVRVDRIGGRAGHVKGALTCRVANGDRPEWRTRLAVREVLEGVRTRRADVFGRRDPGFECGGEGEDLEGRTGLHADCAAMGSIGVVVVRGLAAARGTPLAVLGHCQDVARSGLHHRDGGSAPAFIVNWDCARDRFEGTALRIRTQGRSDGVAPTPQEGLACLRGIAERRIGADGLEDVVAEEGCVRRGAPVRDDGRLYQDLHGNESGLRGLTLGDVSEFGHAGEDDVAALGAALRVSNRVEGGWLLDDAGEGRCLGEGEFGR